jgi:hypothetical protein
MFLCRNITLRRLLEPLVVPTYIFGAAAAAVSLSVAQS